MTTVIAIAAVLLVAGVAIAWVVEVRERDG